MTLQTTTIRPGFLVSLKTSMRGNVSHDRRIIERNHKIDDGSEKERWETVRTTTDPEEWDRGCKVRSEATTDIRKVCVHSAFGLLCPESAAEELAEAMKAARERVEEFNNGASLTRISVYIMAGRIAADDVEAVKSINSEMRDLIDTMSEGVKNLDVKVIREAANKAKSVGQMLAPGAQERAYDAIALARKAAREIIAAGEQATVEIDRTTVRKIREARVAFIDTDETESEIAKPVQRKAAIDISDDMRVVEELSLGDQGREAARRPRKTSQRQLDLSEK